MKRFFATLLAAVGLLFVGVAISLFVDAARGKDVSDSLGGGGVCLAMALLAGLNSWRLYRPARIKAKKASPEELEHAALKCAAASGGKLTETGLSLDAGLSLDEAKRVLASLVDRGAAEIEVSSSGALVYAFPGLISEGEKQAAKPVEDA